MSEIILKEGDDLLNNIISLNLEDENNFLNLAERTFPLLPNPQKATQQFRVFRNTLAKRPVANSNLTAKLERVNSVANEQVQGSKLVKIDNTTFKIREKTDTLVQDIKNLEIKLDHKIDNTSSDLQDKLEEIFDSLDRIEKKIDKIDKIFDGIENLKDFIIDEIKKLKEYLKLHIKKPLLEIENKFKDLLTTIHEMQENISKILGVVETIVVLIGPFIPPSSIFTITNRLIVGQDQLLGGIGAILAALTGEAIDPKNIKPALDNFKNKIKEAIDEWFKNTDEEIYKNSTDYICEKIVGESYIKYDSFCSFWPTLLFKFKSIDTQKVKQYSQIKIRYFKKPNDIVEADINTLKLNIQMLYTLNYKQGTLRANYIDKNRLFRTTIFVDCKETVIKLLKTLIPLGLLEFQEKQLSYTEQNERFKVTKRTNSLGSFKLNKVPKIVSNTMTLNSVYLQINGLEKQIKLL